MPDDPRHLTPQPLEIGDSIIAPGERRDAALVLSHSYSGAPVTLPLTVWRARQPGPTVFVTAAVHGDEVNGAGVIRDLILHPKFNLVTGTLILVPVVNILGFERHSRYLPDRRDLNRCFPGARTGSPSSRLAHTIFRGIVTKCDFGIDFHTAALRRTNYPNVRADLSDDRCARIARAFGSELVVNGRGPKGSLRRSAVAAGCPTIILEAGEPWKIEPSVVEFGIRGVRNVLIELGMVAGQPHAPPYQALIERTGWVRADVAGMLQFHVAPGDLLDAGQPIATSTTLLGRELSVIRSPGEAIVLGMATLPSAVPGDPIVHLAFPDGGVASIRSALNRARPGLHERLRDDLATSVTISQPPPVDGDGESG